MIAARRGIALPLALLALVVIAALIAGGFTAALLEQRIGRNALYAVQAEGAALAGAAEVLAGWDTEGLGLLAPGGSTALPSVHLSEHTVYWPGVSRLNDEMFLVRVEGIRADADGGALARREVGLLVRVADSAVAGLPSVSPLANRAWVAP